MDARAWDVSRRVFNRSHVRRRYGIQAALRVTWKLQYRPSGTRNWQRNCCALSRGCPLPIKSPSYFTFSSFICCRSNEKIIGDLTQSMRPPVSHSAFTFLRVVPLLSKGFEIFLSMFFRFCFVRSRVTTVLVTATLTFPKDWKLSILESWGKKF